MTAAVAALALTVASSQVSALTLPVIGGPGLDQGQICPTGSLCPGTPVFSLFGVAATTGSFTYNAGPGTVDFSLTLTAPANVNVPEPTTALLVVSGLTGLVLAGRRRA